MVSGIKFRKKTRSFRIYASQKECDEMTAFLLQKKSFVEDHSRIHPRGFKFVNDAVEASGKLGNVFDIIADYQNEEGRETSISDSFSRFIEVDAAGIEALSDSVFNTQISQAVTKATLRSEIQACRIEEQKLAPKLLEQEYNLDLRIWQKEQSGKTTYFVKVGEDNYSSEDLVGLISFLKGQYLVESYKDRTTFSTNPLTAFGVIDSAWHAAGGNKSLLRYNWKKRDGLKVPRKKQYQPIIEDVEHFKIVIDGADDTASALNNTGLPQQTIALMQGLLIFPIFLKGVHLGYQGLGGEAKEVSQDYEKANYEKMKLEAELDDFKRRICEICDIDRQTITTEDPKVLLAKIADQLIYIKQSQFLSDAAKEHKINEIIELADEFQRKIEEDPEIASIRNVVAAYAGWGAMTSMLSAVAVYELQAVMNIFGGVEGISKKSMAESSSIFAKSSLPPSSIAQRVKDLPALSQVASYFGFVGQVMMSAYAAHKAYEEYQEWSEIEEDLLQFSKAKNVSELAKAISTKILKGKRDKHRNQFFGNIALSVGQAGMAMGGGIGTFAGLGLTLGGVALNSLSELRYQSSFAVNEDYDDFEREMLNAVPQFNLTELNNIEAAVERYMKQHMFKLEILGHLRAPHMALYQKYIERNRESSGILGSVVLAFGGKKISKWINDPPADSLDLIDDGLVENALILVGNDLDVFAVEKADFDFALKRADELLSEGKTHKQMVEILQKEFMQSKLQEHRLKPPKSAIEICKEVLQKDKSAADYLKKKILRAIGNGDLHYKAGEVAPRVPSIKKNGRTDLTLVELDIDKIEEAELENFLIQRRQKKHSLSSKKKESSLAKSYKEQFHDIKSAHLRPFAEIVKESENADNFVSNFTIERKLQIAAPVISNNKTVSKLNNFRSLVREDISTDESERKKQVKRQNNAIDEIRGESKEFKLIRTEIEADKTIFIYIDPRYEKKTNDPKYRDHLVFYVRDDESGKIDVFCGKKVKALFTQQANKSTNANITSVNELQVEHYGNSEDSKFSSFEAISPEICKKYLNPSATVSPRDKEAKKSQTHSVKTVIPTR